MYNGQKKNTSSAAATEILILSSDSKLIRIILLIKHFISGTVSTLQFMFKLIINIRRRVMYFVLGCYLRWTMSSSSLYEVEFLFSLFN
ncbi:hypothetical protein T12_1378 [Trichinella patagoniensis]|uniref:Uncharacterized protein n=1 Tax=Trichinella patagoniensis TaxID=990121 RepID=A0A0V1A194_9BILA|nr:hypothetical protein T12_1378 [Trichinella patagoniensis]